MPLTISHPAAAVPLTRLGLVLSALVIGSMTPDLPYFIPLLPSYSGLSHSMIGLFVYCVPLGLLALGIFHFLIKYPALSLLPSSHQDRLYELARDFSFWPLRRFLLIIVSILVGAFTHILWDSFTHPQSWMTEQSITLKLPVFGLRSVPMYDFLQYGSTLFGGVLLFYWYVKWYKSAKSSSIPPNLTNTTSTKFIILTVMCFIALGTALFSGIASISEIQTTLYRRLINGHIFVVSVSTFTSELMLFSAYWHFRPIEKENKS
jgi:hypothetical protein